MNKNQNLVVGGFVLMSLAILLFGIYFLKETIPGRRLAIYYVHFNQVSTLQDGDPIKVNGVKMGKVEGITLQGHDVRVTLKLEKHIKLTRGSEVRIQNIGLMGERQIGIRLGESAEILPPGTTLEGTLDAGIAEAMGVAGEVFVEAETLVKSLHRVLDSTVGKPEFVTRFNRLLDETEKLTIRLNEFVSDVDPQVRRSLGQIEKAGVEVNQIITSQKEPIAAIVENGRVASERVKALSERADRVAGEMEVLLQQINSDKGTVGALLRDSTMHRELARTLNSADSLFRVIQKKGLDVNLNLF